MFYCYILWVKYCSIDRTVTLGDLIMGIVVSVIPAVNLIVLICMVSYVVTNLLISFLDFGSNRDIWNKKIW